MSRIASALPLLAATLLAFASSAQAQALTKIKVGTVRAPVVGAVVSAKEHGYFKDAGLDVEIEMIDASSAFVSALATNALNVVEGGVSANLFNGILQGLPIKSAFDSTSTPTNHYLMRRIDLADKIKTLKDLKGAVLAVNAPNSIALYETTRILDSEGVSISDLEIKVIPFAQMGVAFQTKAIDIAFELSPFTSVLQTQGIATRWMSADKTVKPSPVQTSTSMYNTDWAAKNPEIAQKFFTALLRGVRDYCNAYHGGAYRPELLKLLVANVVGTSTESIDQIPWPVRSPDGFVFKDSVSDIQKWYIERGLVRSEVPIDKIVNDEFAKNALKELGPFKLENTASKLGGCGRPAVQ